MHGVVKLAAVNCSYGQLCIPCVPALPSAAGVAFLTFHSKIVSYFWPFPSAFLTFGHIAHVASPDSSVKVAVSLRGSVL